MIDPADSANDPGEHAGGQRAVASVRAWWRRHGTASLRLSLLLLGALAVLKLGSESWRLTVQGGFDGAVDLRLRYNEVRWWFSGQPFYTGIGRLTYPPHTYVLLWPFIGWMDFGTARWVWLLTTALAVGILVRALIEGSGGRTRVERAFVLFMVLSMNAVGVAVGNGQLVLHLLAALVAGLLLLRRRPADWRTDLLAAILLAVALAKPTLTIPFVWIALVVAGRAGPILLTGVVCTALTLIAASFQPDGLITLLNDWWAQSRPRIGQGYGDIPSALAVLGLTWLAIPASLAALGALGVWTWRNRHADFWILLGVSALVARFWMYHRVYDDVLILFAMAALFRIAKRGGGTGNADVKAGILLAIAVAVMLAPARMETAGPPFDVTFVVAHVITWAIMLLFLGRVARAAVLVEDPARTGKAAARAEQGEATKE